MAKKKSAPKVKAKLKAKPVVKQKAKPAKKTAAKALAKANKKVAKKAQPAAKAPVKSTAKSAVKSKAPSVVKSPAPKVTASKVTAAKAPAKKITAKNMSNVFTPLDNRVLVQREGVVSVTPGGIIIPDSVSTGEKPNQGTVLAVGRGHLDKKGRLRPLDVNTGDRVMFNSFAGAEVRIENEDYVLLREDEIIAILKA